MKCVDDEQSVCSNVFKEKKLKLPDYEMSLPNHPGGIALENMYMARNIKDVTLENLYGRDGGAISIILD